MSIAVPTPYCGPRPAEDDGDGGVPGRAVRLLLADDSPVERLALAHLLRRAGYEVDEADDGKSAMLLLQHRPIDLLLLDLQMPTADGFDVLTYLHQHRPGLPVILLSGLPPNEIQHSMHRLPTQELPPLMLKPVDPDQLIQLLELRLSGELPGAAMS